MQSSEGGTKVHCGLCNNAKYSTAVHIIQCFSMQNLGLLKFLFLVNPVSVTLWQTAMDQITIIFAHNVSCLHPLTYLSPLHHPQVRGCSWLPFQINSSKQWLFQFDRQKSANYYSGLLSQKSVFNKTRVANQGKMMQLPNIFQSELKI